MEDTHNETVEDEGEGDPVNDIGDPTGDPWDTEGDDDGSA